jgi:hypothetical protein
MTISRQPSSMRARGAASVVLMLTAAFALSACARDEPPPTSDAPGARTAAAPDAQVGLVERTTRQAIERAREKIASGNISVGGGGSSGSAVILQGSRTQHGDLPRAEISPQGDFIIDGRTQSVDAGQRRLLLAHRANIVAVADAGMEIGIQGAQLGLGAAREALGAVLGGQTGDLEARLRAESDRLEIDAKRICDRMPALLESQQALAEALPAFEPYAQMTAADVDECRRGSDSDSGGASDASAAARTAPASVHAV